MNKLKRNSVLGNFARLSVLPALLTAMLLTPVTPAKAGDGTIRYVSPGGSNTTDCASASSPCQTIAYAQSQSSLTETDTLLLDVGVYTENLLIDRNIRIVQDPAKDCPQSGSLNYEPCAIIDGNYSGRVINIAAGFLTVSLEKLTIRNGFLNESSPNKNGAGIYNNGTLTLDDINLYDNHISGTNLDYRGGGIENQNTLTIRGSSVHDNSAYDGGGITSAGPLTMQNTEIYNNNAVRFGGGIWLPYGNPSTMENSTLWGNSAGFDGGGVYINNGLLMYLGEVHRFANVTISGNSADVSGGGLVSHLEVVLDHCTIAQNSAPGSGADLILTESQRISDPPNDHSIIYNTIVSNPTASDPICSITGIDTFDLSAGGNLSSDNSCDFTQINDQVNSDPLLMAVADNGGHVRTRALTAGSPAIDQAGPYILGADARGITPQDGDRNGSIVPDVGAFEFVPGLIYLPIIMR